MFNWFAYLTYIVITAFTPGPNCIMSMHSAGTYGLRKSYPFNLGVFCGFSIVMLICTMFSAMLFKFLPSIKPVMQVVGAGYMLYLAWKTWRSSFKSKDDKKTSTTFLSGALLQFVNPKVMLCGITALSSYILPHFSAIPVLIGFALLHAFTGFSGTILWAFFGMAFSALFTKYPKLINGILALLLVYCAVSLFL